MLGLPLVFNPNSSEQGIKVLLFTTNQYPKSANLFDSLAEAYLWTTKERPLKILKNHWN